jgi:hypothetical protein
LAPGAGVAPRVLALLARISPASVEIEQQRVGDAMISGLAFNQLELGTLFGA